MFLRSKTRAEKVLLYLALITGSRMLCAEAGNGALIDSEPRDHLAELKEEAWSIVTTGLASDVPQERESAAMSMAQIPGARARGGLLTLLRSRRESVRSAAAGSLTAARAQDLSGILRESLATERHFWTRVRIVEALARTGQAEAADVIGGLLEDPDSLMRGVVLGQLELMGRVALPVLGDALSKADEPERETVVYVIGRIGDASQIPVLRRALLDQSPKVRLAAALMLSRLNDPTGLDQLRRGLGSADNRMRLQIADALLRLGDTGQRQEVLRALKDPSPTARARAVMMLLIPTPAPTLEGALAGLLRDPDTSVRVSAVEALSKIGDSAAYAALRGALRDPDDFVRVVAAEKLAAIGDHSWFGVVAPALKSQNEEVRRRAASLAGNSGNSDIIAALLGRLHDGNWLVRIAVLKSLSEVGDRSSVAAVSELLDDEDCSVALAAAQSVAKLEGIRAVPVLEKKIGAGRPTTRIIAAGQLLTILEKP